VPFKRILTELVTAVPGASGAILADWEGEAVEQFSFYDDFEMKLIGAHKGIILNRVREAYADLNVGELQEIVISAQDQRFGGAIAKSTHGDALARKRWMVRRSSVQVR